MYPRTRRNMCTTIIAHRHHMAKVTNEKSLKPFRLKFGYM